MGRSTMPRLETASTARMAPLPRVTSAYPRTSWSTPVEVSLCWTRTALISGRVRSASATRAGGTVSPNGARRSTATSPYAFARSAQRSANLPARTMATVSPGESVLTTAASIAPVPEHVRGITSCAVWKIRLSPARTSTKSASYSGVRWWMIVCAIAGSAWLGTGVGPGAMSCYFFMEATLPRRFGPSAEGGDEDRVQSLGVRREEPHDLVVIEREPRRAEALRVRGEVRAPADEPGLEVGEAGAAVAPRGEQRIERREE